MRSRASFILAAALVLGGPQAAFAKGCCAPIVSAVKAGAASIVAAIGASQAAVVAAIASHGQDQVRLIDSQTQAIVQAIDGLNKAQTARQKSELALKAKEESGLVPPGACPTATTGRRLRGVGAVAETRARAVVDSLSAYTLNPAAKDRNYGGTVARTLKGATYFDQKALAGGGGERPLNANLIFDREPLKGEDLEKARLYNRLVVDPAPPSKPVDDKLGGRSLAHRARAARISVAQAAVEALTSEKAPLGASYTKWARSVAGVSKIDENTSWYELMRGEAERRFLTGFASMDLSTDTALLRDLNQQGAYRMYLAWRQYELQRQQVYMMAAILSLLTNMRYEMARR